MTTRHICRYLLALAFVLLVSVDGWGAVYGAPEVEDDSVCVWLGDLAECIEPGSYARVYWLCLGVESPE